MISSTLCSLVMAKAMVAPTKITSFTRLELSAAVTSIQMSFMLKTELEMKVDGEFFWTDSEVVLAHINDEVHEGFMYLLQTVFS